MMELVKIDRHNVWDIVKLSVREEQKDFVAPNGYSIIEAYAVSASGGTALPFGLYEDGAPVGFAMIGYGCEDDKDPKIADGNYCLWRFMIDGRYQGRGLGKKAMAAVMDFIGTFPCGKAEYCWLSYEPENIAAKNLYRLFGFEENGEWDGDEAVAVLKLQN
ncbi:MAG: GNAT family N-acetyltransferase [Candidatus Avispirillum sp.]